MRNPWQIWLAFFFCLAGIAAAMGWLSVKIIELDSLAQLDRNQTEVARREAELQERVSSALYRMDLMMLPLVAQEAARPHYLYKSFYELVGPANPRISEQGEQKANEKDTSLRLPSPLLFQPDDFVVFHFQITPDNQITSPRFPTSDDLREAVAANFVSQADVEAAEATAQQASLLFDFEQLIDQCSEIKLPRLGNSNSLAINRAAPASNYGIPAVENLREQIKNESINQDIQQQLASDNNKVEMQRSRGKERVNDEFNRRRDNVLEFARQSSLGNSFGYGNGIGFGNGQQAALSNAAARPQSDIVLDGHPLMIRCGVMQPIWVDDHLVLARRIEHSDQTVIQCCWLDWQKIQKSPESTVVDLLPGVQFQPVTSDTVLKQGTALTTIPVQLVVDSPKLLSSLAFDSEQGTEPPVSGLRWSLLVAWCGLGLAALASAILLRGVMQLSERRAAFVAAVTHELRTPLTTFRMYAEMAAENMVPEEKQQQYANTMKDQADRLSYLVENVLQFARLERGPSKISNETVSIEELFSRFSFRLKERAAAADMTLSINIVDSISGLKISTQPSTVEQIIFNLVDNACKYAQPASRNEIEITCRQQADALQFCVRDFGPGVNPKYHKRMFRPFYQSEQVAANTVSGIGLGLALCRSMAASLGGQVFHEQSEDGATFVLELRPNGCSNTG